MAIAQAMCTAFKKELMLGTHNFATNGNAFKLALYAEGGGGKSSTTATLGAVLLRTLQQAKLLIVVRIVQVVEL